MRFFPSLAFCVALAAAVMCGSTALWALGGRLASPEPQMEAHVVMVLGREGARHSACTGTLVAQNVVLTAAHCVFGTKKMIAIAYAEGSSHVLQRVVARAIHPGFHAKQIVSVDLALVRVESDLPARFSPLPFALLGEAIPTHHPWMIAGFGMANDTNEASAGTLRSTTLTQVGKSYPRFLRLGRIPEATSLSDLAICTGDSGGPVLSGQKIIGVVYGREEFRTAKHCGVIAQAVRIAPQEAWIKKVLQQWKAPQ